MWWHWVVAIGRDVWCVLKMAWWHLTGVCGSSYIWFHRPFVWNEHSKETPIVLIHGSSGNQSEWLHANDQVLETFDKHPVYAFSLDLAYDAKTGRQIGGLDCKTTFGMKWLAKQHDWTIEKYAEELAVRIEQAKLKTPVILIGHSMGGLICAQYERIHPTNVRSLIAFSSPFGGAPLLNNSIIKFFNNSKRHRQMTPRSDFLVSLDPRVQWLDDEKATPSVDSRMRRYLTIGSPHDLQVPNDYSKIPHVKHIEVDGYGHFSIVKCDQVWRQVYDFVLKC